MRSPWVFLRCNRPNADEIDERILGLRPLSNDGRTSGPLGPPRHRWPRRHDALARSLRPGPALRAPVKRRACPKDPGLLRTRAFARANRSVVRATGAEGQQKTPPELV